MASKSIDPNEHCQHQIPSQQIKRRRRKRCNSWNFNSRIPVEETTENEENLVSGQSVICLSMDGSQLIVSFFK